MTFLGYKTLNDGVNIPMIGLGTGKLTDQCTETVKKAIEIGYRHIDTATYYQNHQLIKKAIEGFPRKDLFITSKLAKWDHDPKMVVAACDKALQELGIDYLDLYLVHWPQHSKGLVDVVGEMFRLKEKGKLRSVGLSNAEVHHIQDIFNAGMNISLNQFEIHPLFSQEPLVSFCHKHSIAVTAYRSFANNLLHDNETLKTIAKKKERSLCQVILRWLHQRGIIVIPKTVNPKHLESNFKIASFSSTLR